MLVREGYSIFCFGHVGQVISATRGFWYFSSRDDVRVSEAVRGFWYFVCVRGSKRE